MSARQQARMEQASTDAIRGAFADKIPPMEPTLRDLAIRAVEDADAFSEADEGIIDDEFHRLDHTSIDARDALYVKLGGLGLDRALLTRMGKAGIL